MAHTNSTRKRIRQSRRANLRNRHYKSMMKTSLKAVDSAEKTEDLQKAYKEAVSTIDKLVQKGILHRNNGANKKSKLAKRVNKRLA